MTNELQASFDVLHGASRLGAAPDLAARKDSLSRLQRLITENRQQIITAIADDFGTRATEETELFEIVQVLSAIRHAKRCVRRWMRDESRPVAWPYWPGKAWVRYEPLGVVGIIVPWNFPLLLALSPLTSALAAGNRALIKPSELTPKFGTLLADLILKYFPPDEVSVVLGGVDEARAFTALPFDHLIFTGSTEVGRHVMRSAADNLTPTTLELGGKSPTILATDYPVDQAAKAIVRGKFSNAGQACIAPDYILVPEDRLESFTQALLTATAAGYPAPQENPQYTNIISLRHRDRLTRAIQEAEAQGAKVITTDASAGNKIAPTIVLNPPMDSTLMKEEIFGPALPVISYKTLDDAINFTNGFARPLALYIFTHDKRVEKEILSRITSGNVTINNTLLHIAQEELPFGGIGPSGMGAYHGKDGFKQFSHARGIFKPRLFSAADIIGPPWGTLAQWVIKILGR